MAYIKYTFIMLTCYFGVLISGLLPIFFFDSFRMFLGSYVFMSLGMTILLFGLLFIAMKEDQRMKAQLYIIHTITFLMFHYHFSSYEMYSALVICYPILAIMTVVAYSTLFLKYKQANKQIFY